MKYTFTNIEREFAPSEAAEITGVSLAMQRDWRRREILPPNEKGGWARFGVRDLIIMSVLKRFSDGGISVKQCQDLAHMAVLPTGGHLWAIPGSVEIDDQCNAPPEVKRDLLEKGAFRGNLGRYLMAFIPEDGPPPRSIRFISMEALEVYQVENMIDHYQAVDCWVLAERIFDRAGRKPLYRIEISSDEGDAGE